MTEHREYRVLRGEARGGREPGILVASTRDRDYADRILRDFAPRYSHVEVWMETRLVTDWARLECPERYPGGLDEITLAGGELP